MIEQQLQLPTIEKEQPICRIELPFPDLKDSRKESVKKECYMDIYKGHICYKVVASYECKDDDTDIWREKIANYRWTRLRRNICSVSMYRDSMFLTYALSLEFMGVDGDGTLWHFEDPKECLRAYEILKDYMVEGL